MADLVISHPENVKELLKNSPVFDAQSLKTEVSYDACKCLIKSMRGIPKGIIYSKEGQPLSENENKFRFDFTDIVGNLPNFIQCEFTFTCKDKNTKESAQVTFEIKDDNSNVRIAQTLDEGLNINVLKGKLPKKPLLVLFNNIRTGCERLGFKNYKSFTEAVMRNGPTDGNSKSYHEKFPMRETDSYNLLKASTEAFLILNLGVQALDPVSEEDLRNKASNSNISFNSNGDFNDDGGNPNWVIADGELRYAAALFLIKEKLGGGYSSSVIDRKLEELKSDGSVNLDAAQEYFATIRHKLRFPLFLELIWSYWHEEGMLVQTFNAICRRFQNMRGDESRDPLAEMEITHLLPLNNLLWGFIQDEPNRLSVKRRAYEYDHHYGITIQGKAVSSINSADSRTKFIVAFHSLLHMADKYYKESANTLVKPDAYPLLNSLKELNFVIAEGMHNQYGDMPSVSRMEMLMQQWMLSAPEFRVFLPGRISVPYPEPWMDRVASMNRLQGWTDSSPMDFNNLANYGELLLLTVRYGLWNQVGVDQNDAILWVEYFRAEIQGYIHSYKAVTGVDLTTTLVDNKIDSRPPSYHLAQRLQERQNGRQNGKIPTPSQPGIPIKKEAIKKEWY